MSVFQSKLSGIVLTALFLSFVIQIYIGYIQAINNHWQSLSIRACFYNSGFFANYLASLTPVFLYAFLRPSQFITIKRIDFLIIYFAALVLIFATMARAAIIATIAGSLFVALPRYKKVKLKWFFLLCIPFVVVCGLLLYKLKPDSALGRLTIYRVAANIIRDHPLTGVGPNRFSAYYNNYQSQFFREGQHDIQTQLTADNTFEGFNSIIQVLVEYGLIGLLLLVLIGYYLIRSSITNTARTNIAWLKRGSWGCIISILVSSLFSNPFHVTPILPIFCYHLSVITSSICNVRCSLFDIQCRIGKFLLLITATVFTVLVSVYVFVHYRAERKWESAAKAALYDNFGAANKLYLDAYPCLKYNGDFLYNYGAEACLAGEYDLAINILRRAKRYVSCSNLFVYLGDAYTATGNYLLAEKNYLHAIYMVPSHIYPKFQLIQLYKRWGKPDLAKAWTVKTLEYPIKVKSDFVQMLIQELRKDI